MSVFRRVLDRLTGFPWTSRKVTLRVSTDPRAARFALPLIKKLLAEDDDGETYRTALIDWHRAERPPLALYHGTTSFCRIDGPSQWVGDRPFPLGGLILSPGVTAHLDPFEAEALHEHMQGAVERAIRAWLADRSLRAHPAVPVEFDRRKADHTAKAMIAAWAARQERNRRPAADDAKGPRHV
ncbi:hypothetical protein [Sphingosinicella microcystinivorans]|uniref:Uncharacterized protein n=1 Tax=Sphingosinicella microcystinivorans TaxID=335406 RepID=A0AAD1D6E2_SPHMI|nr:hypothetical protein [Sphingosinicella microcystinivorans]RKS91792.1 hypothetical protein DFR51_1362 [Sphingosinicella microcystinivorans]BBE34778.1 hypothetical protein SmB9_24360 [Sphingosinicella microcystinivorans]